MRLCIKGSVGEKVLAVVSKLLKKIGLKKGYVILKSSNLNENSTT